nr:MAG TPA: hypothetical protein [Caudoviricetes sp.]
MLYFLFSCKKGLAIIYKCGIIDNVKRDRKNKSPFDLVP